jgi:hypothetical protein
MSVVDWLKITIICLLGLFGPVLSWLWWNGAL